jgi:hypothetical protein
MHSDHDVDGGESQQVCVPGRQTRAPAKAAKSQPSQIGDYRVLPRLQPEVQMRRRSQSRARSICLRCACHGSSLRRQKSGIHLPTTVLEWRDACNNQTCPRIELTHVASDFEASGGSADDQMQGCEDSHAPKWIANRANDAQGPTSPIVMNRALPMDHGLTSSKRPRRENGFRSN